MAKKQTVFQALDAAISGNWTATNDASAMKQSHVNTYDMSAYKDKVLYRTNDKDDYEQKKLELRQDKWLKDRWIKANVDLSVTAYNGLNNIKLMYRDADLMDAFPEIGAALDTYAEESCVLGQDGSLLNVYSKSTRIKSILEDLFVNRLNIHLTAPMVIRAMCKYGNQFMLLDVDHKNGVKGWKQLPVFNVERIENGISTPYGGGQAIAVNGGSKNPQDTTTQFVWLDADNSQVPFRDWQVAHFRLLTNSLYLPYGISILNAARRHWRMLSLMEDMMLIYRLERSMERRVYKIFVGNIDDADVKAYVEQVANEFKRTPIIDPITGQLDLRKNILPVHKDTPIPLLDGRTITIAELSREYEEGKDNYVYSIQDNTLNVVPGRVAWCGKNYTADRLVKITLDDGTYAVMAEEHEVVMRDGSKKRADELVSGDSVMPFYRKVDKNSPKLFDRYEKVYNPNSGKFEFTHRIVGKCVEKGDEKYNTVHHKDFNKYNNNPTNLLWMDYYEHHKAHGDLARANWADQEKRANTIKKLSESCRGRVITQDARNKISASLKEKYASGEMDFVKEMARENITKYNKSTEHIELARELGVKRGYREEFKQYNESSLHKQHDEIRRQYNIDKWKNEERRVEFQRNMTVKFDSYVWDVIRENILNGAIKTQNGMIDFINTNLIDYLMSINSSKKLRHYKKVTKPLVKARIVENGFASFCDYYVSIKKNHKVTSIEFIGGDDVYCMTVVGLNGEDDRHNFAIRTWNLDASVSESGFFVRNCVDNDIFIPTRDENAPTPIDTLSAGQNLTAMDDIKFIQNKLFTALRVPKSFLNFEENAGDGKNLALMDVRFTRMVNRVQQAFLMELTKVAMIHLYLLGFKDELTNFTLSMNNPSTQAEQLEIESLQKKIDAVRDAVSDPGNGIPVISWIHAMKMVFKMSDAEIQEILEEIRLEKGISAELEKTPQIIKRTGLFDKVDRVYGEPGAKYVEGQEGVGGDGMDGGFGGGGGGMPPMGGGQTDFGEDLDNLGGVGGEEGGDINGTEGSVPTQEMPSGNEGGAPPMEAALNDKKLIDDNKVFDALVESYLKDKSRATKLNETMTKTADIYDKDALLINEGFEKMIDELGKFVVDNDNKETKKKKKA